MIDEMQINFQFFFFAIYSSRLDFVSFSFETPIDDLERNWKSHIQIDIMGSWKSIKIFELFYSDENNQRETKSILCVRLCCKIHIRLSSHLSQQSTLASRLVFINKQSIHVILNRYLLPPVPSPAKKFLM